MKEATEDDCSASTRGASISVGDNKDSVLYAEGLHLLMISINI